MPKIHGHLVRVTPEALHDLSDDLMLVGRGSLRSHSRTEFPLVESVATAVVEEHTSFVLMELSVMIIFEASERHGYDEPNELYLLH